MRMQVAVDGGEVGELVDGVALADDTGGAPVVELPKATLLPQLQEAVEIADHHAHRGGGEGEEPPLRQRQADRRQFAERQAADRDHAEVVGDVIAHRGQAGEVGEHQVPEVIIVERLARHPHVLWRHYLGACQGVEKREVHELLGAEDLGPERPLPGEKDEPHGPEQVVGEERTPARTAQPVRQPVPCGPCQPRVQQHVRRQRRRESDAQGQAAVAQCPRPVGDQQQRQDLPERVAVPGARREHMKHEGQGDQAQRFEYQPPDNQGSHSCV